MNHELNISIAILMLRLVTGILFFFQGYDKIFNIKIEGVVRTFSDTMKSTWIPLLLLRPLVYLSSYIEMICGALLCLGLFREYSLFMLAADMVFVAFAFSSIKAMWDMHFYLPRIIFLAALLLLSPEMDRWSLDQFIFKLK
ncbi:MAG: DoxX family protein [Bacteroidetes bacterium]|nr:DoxX family protein [Bacteroidota bacterium]MBL0066360.1 DoxX family protein [Bacteroidota bacterium]MBL0138988.1 DoxX family protein [Bacteroidota bacterium]